MLTVLITRTPGCGNEFIDCQQAKVRIAVPRIIDVITRWILSLELLDQAFQLQEITRKWPTNAQYSDHQPLFTIHDESTIVKYVMDDLRTFRYWTLAMSKRHTVTLHHVITD